MNTRSPFRRSASFAAASFLWLFAVATSGSLLHAADPESAGDVHADLTSVAPLIEARTIVVAKFDLARTELPDAEEVMRQLQLPGLSALVRPHQPGAEEEVRVAIEQANEWLASLKTAAGEQPIYATVGIPRSWPGRRSRSRTDQPVVFFTEPSDDLNREAFRQQLGGFLPDAALHEREGMVVLARGDRTPATAVEDGRTPRQELEEALQAVARFPIQLLFLPPDHLRRTMLELVPRLPDAWGGGRSEVWVEGVRWAALGFDPATMEAELVVQSASDQAAERLGKHVEKLLQRPEQVAPELEESFPLEKLLNALRAQLEVDRQHARWTARLQGEASYELGATMLLAAVSGIQERVRGHRDANKLKQILLAMHNYHEVHGTFPPPEEARDEKGRPKLSWRVHLLPFIGEGELYQQFRLDEPWDSPHNQELIDRMPQVYASWWSGAPAGQTTFLAPVGEDTVFGGPEPTRFQDVTDGTSNTAVVVEVDPKHAVPWTAPEDYAFDPQDPGVGLREGPDGKFLAAFMDGSVNRLRKDASAEMLRRLFHKSDGKLLDRDALR